MLPNHRERHLQAQKLADMRHQLLSSLVQIEARIRTLTPPSEIGRMLEEGKISPESAAQRYIDMGMIADSAGEQFGVNVERKYASRPARFQQQFPSLATARERHMAARPKPPVSDPTMS